MRRLFLLLTTLLMVIPAGNAGAQTRNNGCFGDEQIPAICRAYIAYDSAPGEPVGWAVMLLAFEDAKESTAWVNYFERTLSEIDGEPVPLKGMPRNAHAFAFNSPTSDGMSTSLIAARDHWGIIVAAVSDTISDTETLVEIYLVLDSKLPDSGDPEFRYLPEPEEMPGDVELLNDGWDNLDIAEESTSTTSDNGEGNTSETGRTDTHPDGSSSREGTTRPRRNADTSETETPESGTSRPRRNTDTSATETPESTVTRTRRNADTTTTETPESRTSRPRRNAESSPTPGTDNGVVFSDIDFDPSIGAVRTVSVTLTIANDSDEDLGMTIVHLACMDESGDEIGSGTVILEELPAGTERTVPGMIAKVPGCADIVPTVVDDL